jgi:hypothetical protein
MLPNMPKYFTYRYSIDQIKNAIDSGFYLEAITIEESIIVDRLFRFCKDNGLSKPVSQATLGTVEMFLRKLPSETQQNEQIDFLEDLDLFRQNRNQCLHQIAKSEPGDPTMPFEEFEELARTTAISGVALMKKVSNWAKKYKRKITKNGGNPSND